MRSSPLVVNNPRFRAGDPQWMNFASAASQAENTNFFETIVYNRIVYWMQIGYEPAVFSEFRFGYIVF